MWKVGQYKKSIIQDNPKQKTSFNYNLHLTKKRESHKPLELAINCATKFVINFKVKSRSALSLFSPLAVGIWLDIFVDILASKHRLIKFYFHIIRVCSCVSVGTASERRNWNSLCNTCSIKGLTFFMRKEFFQLKEIFPLNLHLFTISQRRRCSRNSWETADGGKRTLCIKKTFFDIIFGCCSSMRTCFTIFFLSLRLSVSCSCLFLSRSSSHNDKCSLVKFSLLLCIICLSSVSALADNLWIKSWKKYIGKSNLCDILWSEWVRKRWRIVDAFLWLLKD